MAGIAIGIAVLAKVHVVVAFSVGGFLAVYISMLTGSMEIGDKGRVTVSLFHRRPSRLSCMHFTF
jgi:hypothetical protein